MLEPESIALARGVCILSDLLQIALGTSFTSEVK